MIKKKVCIVTNYSTTTNFGALLQAYALNKTIVSLGHEPEDLYITSDYSSKKKKVIKQMCHLQFKELFNEINSKIQMFIVRDQLNARKKVMDEFRYSIPHTCRYSKNDFDDLEEKYDVFICGSDQIFRPSKLTGELEKYLFLGMINNGAIKASYAASIGIETYSDLKTEEQAREYLSSFTKISMRETNATEYIKRITGRDDVVTSIDPVFLINRDEWIKTAKRYKIDCKYILVYMIHGTKKLYIGIKEFARQSGLKIVTFPSMSYKKKPYERNFADIEILNADPFQFIDLLLNADYIFTDSFHGTSMSLILHKEAFVSRANEIAFSRIDNILGLMGAKNMVIPSEGLSPSMYNNKPKVNWSIVDDTIKKQQLESFQYLKEVIEQ